MLKRYRPTTASSMGLSLAFDMATHKGISYMAIRCRVESDGKVVDYYLLATSIRKKHIDQEMHKRLTTLLNGLLPNWKEKLIGCSTDDAQSMTGNVKGVVTRISQDITGGFIRTWCGLHQLDLAIKHNIDKFLPREFIQQLTKLISYLRKQRNFISDMRKMRPDYCKTRWVSLHRVSKWLMDNKVSVTQNLISTSSQYAPSAQWWFLLCKYA